MNYYQPSNDRVYTRTLMDRMGLPNNDKILAKLGFFPIIYKYIVYDNLLEQQLPFDNLVKDGDVYIQNFTKENLPEETIASNLEKYKSVRANDARKAADDSVAAYINDYSDIEKQTWVKQQAEVEAYLEDETTPTPVIDALAEGRGITREEMLEKTINKVTKFDTLRLKIVGKQQFYEDQIKSIAENEEFTPRDRILQLKELVFDYTTEYDLERMLK